MAIARRSPYGATAPEPVTGPGGLRERLPEVAFAGLRVAIAVLMIWHGAEEHFGVLLAPGQQWVGRLTPFSDPWIMATVRLTGGVLLALGLFTRATSVVLAALAVFTHLAAAGPRAFSITLAGELTVLYCVVLLAFAFTGAGTVSLDALREVRRSRRRPAGMTVEMSPWVRRQYRRRDPSR